MYTRSPAEVVAMTVAAPNPFLSRIFQLEQTTRRFVLMDRRDGRGKRMDRLKEAHCEDFLRHDLQQRYNEVRAMGEEETHASSGGRFETRFASFPPSGLLLLSRVSGAVRLLRKYKYQSSCSESHATEFATDSQSPDSIFLRSSTAHVRLFHQQSRPSKMICLAPPPKCASTPALIDGGGAVIWAT